MRRVLALLLLVAAPAAQVELPASLRRLPTELPRAEAGAWATLFGADGPRGEAIAALAESVRAELAASEAAYRKGDYPAAVAAAFRALEAAPDLPPALTLLGTTYFRLQRYGDTVTCFERFLEVAPSEVWRTQALGHAYYSLGRYDRALAHYERVVATDRAGIDALRGLGLTQLELGDEDAGIATLERVVERAPDHGEAHEALARVRFERGESDLALPLAERARELAPFTPRPWFLLAQIYADLGREEDARGAEVRWREVDRVVQTLRRLEAEQELAPYDLALARAIVAARFELGDADGASAATMRTLRRARAGSPELLALATDTADALARLGAFGGSDRWAERITSAFADERAAWEWAARYWGDRRDRLRQLECDAQAKRLAEGR